MPRKKAKKKPRAKNAGRKRAISTTKVPCGKGDSKPVTGDVQARFTEPLRRFSEHDNLRQLIRAQSEKYGDRTFLIHEDDGREYSFAKLDDLTNRVANVLHGFGGVKGARVALLMDNSPDFVFAFLGVMKSGMIAVPMNLDLTDEQLRFQLEDCGVTCAIVSAGLWDRVSPQLEGLPGLMDVLVAGADDDLPGSGDASYELYDYQRALGAADGHEVGAPEITWWDEAQIVYTGQQEGQPRGAILQHRQFMTAARWLSTWLKLGPEQRFMSGLPQFHTMAQIVTLFTPVVIGASVVLSHGFNAARIWKSVERYKVTTLSGVPSMLGILADREVGESKGARAGKNVVWPVPQESPGSLNQRDDVDAREAGLARGHDISSLQRVICGAAPLPGVIHKLFEKVFLVPVIEGYGMGETSGFATLNPGNGTRKIGSVGVAVGDKIAVQDDPNAPEPLEEWRPTAFLRMNPPVFPTARVRERGEICVWGENVLKEYFHRPKLNPQAFAGGWFHTGDVGFQDEDAFLFVEGQKGDLIDTGVVRFMPREVDELLFNHDEVEHAATIHSGDGHKGSLVTTCVVMRKGAFPGGPDDGRLPKNAKQREAKGNEIMQLIEREAGKKKRPAEVRFVNLIPRDTSGKTRVMELKILTSQDE